MSRARKKESCTCIYRCFTSKTPGCIPCLSLGSACPTPLKRLNWRLSFKFPSYTSELRGKLFHKTHRIDPAKARAQTSWSRVWVIITKATRSHNLPITITSLHKETVELGTTEVLRTIISLERFLLQDKRNNNKTNNNGAFLTKALNKGSNLVEPLYSHSDRLSIWNSICNNETKTVFALTCQIQH